jgi:hypothetical protein
MSLEGTELRAPLGLQLVEERLDRDQRLGLQLEHADTRVFRHALVFHDPRHEEDLEVPAHSGLGHPGRVGKLTRAMRASAEQLHHAAAGRIGERFEYIHES